MLKTAVTTVVMPFVLAIYIPTCAKPIKPTVAPQEVKMSELWQEPADLASRDLFYGQGGKEHAPDPDAVYTFKERKRHGVNPGVTVTDPQGREWHVKQAPKKPTKGVEGPIETTLSRILWAVGYHQPPEYFLPELTLEQDGLRRREPGGRFRLEDKKVLEKRGEWSWQQNPFVGTTPYQGLLVILLIFNSSDIKNDNNALYEVVQPDEGEPALWYTVRDLGTALGETGRLNPKRADPDIFERQPFITGVRHGFVKFDYHGWHQELFRGRITPADVRWSCELLSRLSEAQWADAFRAGGYDPQLAQRFIKRAQQKIKEGLALKDDAPAGAARPSTRPAGLRSPGLRSAGPRSAGPRLAGPRLAGTRSAGTAVADAALAGTALAGTGAAALPVLPARLQPAR